MDPIEEKIAPAGTPRERTSFTEKGEDIIEAHEDSMERTSTNSSQKKETIARVIESPVPEEEQDNGEAGQPGNWRSKVGISIPHVPKWNPSFKPPTLGHTGSVLWKLAKFYGPGAIVSVAYIDPDNYQTDIAAGAEFKYKLLFMLLVSQLIAIYLQVLSAKLGAVTGMTLAEMHRIYLPRWLNYFLWAIAEATIICTDVGQVIGTAIAINLLNPKIPLLAGCALSILDAFSILLIYNPRARLFLIRPFELFIAVIVTIVFCLFVVELTKITAPVGQVFKGFLPSREIFVGQGLFQSSALVGGNLMPHSLYVGSSLVHARLREFDIKEDLYPSSDSDSMASVLWRPSYRAIKATLKYTIAELCITIFAIAMFVNVAILVVAAARLPESAGNADLFGMYQLFQTNIGQAAATIFAVGLLFSGTSAGIVATMAGQLVMEGAMNIRINPFVRRLVTRLIAIIPAMIVAAAVGRQGLGQALNACNVVLSIGLIFLTAPIIWYTSNKRYMTVVVSDTPQVRPNRRVSNEQQRRDAETTGANVDECRVNLANGWFNTTWGIIVWLLIVILNIAAIVLLGLGQGDD